VKKQYYAEHIAYLIFVLMAKNQLIMEDIDLLVKVQRRTYTLPVAYDYFCRQFESILLFTAEARDTLDIVGEESTDEKRLLFSCIVAVTQKIYLERCLKAISQEEPPCGD
jgi:ABC-type microcin C transport system permease subunit YejE